MCNITDPDPSPRQNPFAEVSNVKQRPSGESILAIDRAMGTDLAIIR